MKNSRTGNGAHLPQAILLSWLLLLCGCTIVTEELGNPLPEVSHTVTGATTREVLDTLGPPSVVAAVGDGYAFLYEHALIKESQFGISINYLLLRYFKATFGSAEADREILVLTFDRDGRLLRRGFNEWTEDLGGGNSIQLIIAVMSVVDTGEIIETPVSVKWGGAMLQSRLPESLNRQSSPLFGTNGLEINGTPTGAGQRSLEANSFPILDFNSY